MGLEILWKDETEIRLNNWREDMDRAAKEHERHNWFRQIASKNLPGGASFSSRLDWRTNWAKIHPTDVFASKSSYSV